MIVITGGAGFIGSNLAAALEERRERDIVVCDQLGSDDKWRNLGKRELAFIVPPNQLLDFLDDHAHDIHIVFHFGAISSTLETDADLIIANNFTLSHRLWTWCAARGCRPMSYNTAPTSVYTFGISSSILASAGKSLACQPMCAATNVVLGCLRNRLSRSVMSSSKLGNRSCG